MSHRNPLIAVYPGTFDPMTLGHEDLMRRASGLFDKLLLAVAAGHHKRTMFSIDERLEIAREVAKPYRNVDVVAFRGLLRDFVVDNGGNVVVRGLRAVSDFEYEFQMALMNKKLDSGCETVYLMPSEQYTYLNSSVIREIAALGGSVSEFVPAPVEAQLRKKLGAPRKKSKPAGKAKRAGKN